MELSYVLNAIGEFGEVVIEIPITKQQAGELILDAIAGGQLKAEVPNSEPEETGRVRPSRRGKKKGKRLCGNCGGVGHTARTCDRPAASVVSTAKLEDESEKLPENSQLQRIQGFQIGDDPTRHFWQSSDCPLHEWEADENETGNNL